MFVKFKKKTTVKKLFSDIDSLTNIGLQPPFTSRLQALLRQAGIPLTTAYQTKQRLADELWQLHLKT